MPTPLRTPRSDLAPLVPSPDLVLAPAAARACPAARYLLGCNEASRATMASSLWALARIRWDASYMTTPPRDLFVYPWADLRAADVAELRAALERGGGKASTVNRHLSALRGVLGAAFDLGIIDGAELERCRRAARGVRGDDSEPAGRMLEPEEIGKLLATPAPRDRAIVALALFAGLRRHELAGLQLTDVDPKTGALRTVGKGRKSRTLVLPAMAREAVKAWLDVRGRVAGPLFWREAPHGRCLVPSSTLTPAGIWLILRRVAARAGVLNVTPHDYRRTFASRRLDAGIDVVTVAKEMGHADPKTTQKYDRRGEEVMRAASDLFEAKLIEDLKGGRG